MAHFILILSLCATLFLTSIAHAAAPAEHVRSSNGDWINRGSGLSTSSQSVNGQSAAKTSNGIRSPWSGVYNVGGKPMAANASQYYSKENLKNGMKSVFKGGLAGMAFSAGMQGLFNAADYIIDQGELKRPSNVPQKFPEGLVPIQAQPWGIDPSSPNISALSSVQTAGQVRYGGCPVYGTGQYVLGTSWNNNSSPTSQYCNWCLANRSDRGPLLGYGKVGQITGCIYAAHNAPRPAPLVPLTPQMKDGLADYGFDDYFNDTPANDIYSDLIIGAEPPQYSDLTINDKPVSNLTKSDTLTDSTTELITHSDGTSTVSVTDYYYDFDPVVLPESLPLPRPAQETVTQAYDANSNPVGEPEITTRTERLPSSASDSSREPPDFKDDVSQYEEIPILPLIDLEIEEEVTINFNATCPPPRTISSKLIGNIVFDYEPICNFATLIKPLVIASAYIAGARLYLSIF